MCKEKWIEFIHVANIHIFGLAFLRFWSDWNWTNWLKICSQSLIYARRMSRNRRFQTVHGSSTRRNGYFAGQQESQSAGKAIWIESRLNNRSPWWKTLGNYFKTRDVWQMLVLKLQLRICIMGLLVMMSFEKSRFFHDIITLTYSIGSQDLFILSNNCSEASYLCPIRHKNN